MEDKIVNCWNGFGWLAWMRDVDNQRFVKVRIIAFGFTNGGELVPLSMDQSGKPFDVRQSVSFAGIVHEEDAVGQIEPSNTAELDH